MSDTIEILAKEYERLIERDEVLAALEAGGVDNWEGYDDAMEEYWESH